MDEQEQQNVINEEQQDINQIGPTPFSPPPSHKKLIIGIVIVFVLIIVGIAGAYFFLTSNNSVGLVEEQQNQSENIIKSEVFLEAKKLLTLPEGHRGGSINISEDLQHFAYSTEIDGKEFLYADNALIVEGPVGGHFFTSDNRLVYTLYQEDGQYVVVNGEKIWGIFF